MSPAPKRATQRLSSLEFAPLAFYDPFVIMRGLINKLAKIWLVLALAVAPLQAFASPPVSGDHAFCAMHGDQQDSAGMQIQHRHHQNAGNQGAPHCPQCGGHNCDDGKCLSMDCCPVHPQLSMVSAIPAFGRQPELATYPDFARKCESLPPSPLYRPPV
jgi:hypothetical protein